MYIDLDFRLTHNLTLSLFEPQLLNSMKLYILLNISQD